MGAKPGGSASYATAGWHVYGLDEREIVVEFTDEFAGYLWVFPRPDHSSVGIAAPVGSANGAELRARVSDFLARRYPEHPAAILRSTSPILNAFILAVSCWRSRSAAVWHHWRFCYLATP